ncbi:hypothetical protein ALQ64_03140 [Pseudomonas cannabina]|uniref:Uncharacterized protein n=1 Tax=Pseudomonas cannabina TaxID=86840 RepID=A0A3M3K1Z3_PSECA|nr:hypothetical protein [Pseudomonas cannabina]RMN17122.1 hypothetical protein ALQ64_03140 [Pseudomonas cannabina]
MSFVRLQRNVADKVGKDEMKRFIGYTTPQAVKLCQVSFAVALIAGFLASVYGSAVILALVLSMALLMWWPLARDLGPVALSLVINGRWPIKQANVEFLVITQSNAEHSVYVKQKDSKLTLIRGGWYPDVCHELPSHVYVMVEADGINLHSYILDGDDWRYLDNNDLVMSYTGKILLGLSPDVALAELTT